MPAYTSSRWSTRSSSTSSSSYDEHSAYSASTTPTVHSTRPSERSHYHNSDVYSHRPLDEPEYSLYEGGLGSAERTSVETYASSSHSAEDFEDGLPPYDVPDYESEPGVPSALASTPSEFASYFPSTRKMSIKHDDSTVDGNMNLRIDTLAEMSDGTRGDLTLFHLRMHDLRSREFSLRRHCRDSGREICHSTRKYQKPSFMRNPGFKRSMSSALFSLRPHSADGKPTNANLKRQDSGYDSLDETSTQAPSSPQISPQIRSVPRPTNTTILDFSNYSHLEVKRRGAGTSKRYEFRYWGTSYAWRRVATSFGDYKEISYHLVDTKTSASIAHIVPVPLSQSESREEDAKGGWVPPCSMWIADESVSYRSLDVAEVIVASGLIALVDDCIKSRWHQKGRVQMTIPMLGSRSSKTASQPGSPKRKLDEVFNRRETHHPTPLRQMTS